MKPLTVSSSQAFANKRADGCISAFNALLQIPRVSRARGVSIPTLHALIAEHTTIRRTGARREYRVDVRALNAALDTVDPLRPRVQFTRRGPA
jgi:K+-transporting ATPase c subunit